MSPLEKQLAKEQEALDSLVEQRSAIVRRVDDLGREKSTLSHAAIVRKDEAAVAKLAEANEAIVIARLAVEDIDSAITAQRHLVGSAESKLSAHHERDELEHALELVGEARKAGTTLARATSNFVGAYQRFNEAIETARNAGAPIASENLVEVGVRRALNTMLTPVGLEYDTVPPAARATIGEIASAWLNGAERKLKARIEATDTALADKQAA